MTDVKKAPRAPGKSFNDMVREYQDKHVPVDDYILIDKSEWLGDHDIPVDRYITREAFDLEKERIWKKVWQMACREEEIPNVGDSIVYDITDISILVVRASETEIKAYYNVCLHQGRQLRDGPATGKDIRCPFHAFTWNLDGSFKGCPSRWDFPQIEDKSFNLAEVKVATWGGFVFINMDPDSESLESFMGDMGMHWEKFPLEDRYIAGHVAKIYRANWKLAQEAFMEAFHNISTHSQFGVYFGGRAAESGQYDPMGNYSRALGHGEATLDFDWKPTTEEQHAAQPFIGFYDGQVRVRDGFPEPGEEFFDFEVKERRAALREVIGDKVDELNDIEVFGGGYFTLFPNFHPWWAYDEITYRVRPYGNDPEMSVFEIYLLRPFKGERPKPAPIRWVGPDESHIEAADVLGPASRIFDQDEYNIPMVQKGMHNLLALGRGMKLATYQQTKIRHFHLLWDKWTGYNGS